MTGAPASDPEDLAHWGLHCFCIGARRTPHRIVTADNNGRILWMARDGITLSALREAGVEYRDSQLLLMQAFGLLEIDGGALQVVFPMLGSAAIQALTAQVRPATEALAASVANDSTRLLAALSARGWGAHHYAVLFGYALDGLAWVVLRKRGRLPSTALDLTHPYWNGVFWAVYPKRRHVAGTNEVVVNEDAFVAVWTDVSIDALTALAARWQHGHYRGDLPVITPNDPIHLACETIARATADAIEALAVAACDAGVARSTAKEMVVIAGHELIWNVMEGLVAAACVEEPVAIRTQNATPTELEKLVFVRRPVDGCFGA